MAAEKTYRAGIIGVGRKGHGHARGYAGNPRTEVVAAADPDASNLAIFLERFPVPGYADYHEMLAQEEIDIAAPILPVSPNPKVVIDCARAGVRAIYCEKPMAASLAESDAMVEVCASRGIAFASLCSENSCKTRRLERSPPRRQRRTKSVRCSNGRDASRHPPSCYTPSRSLRYPLADESPCGKLNNAFAASPGALRL